MVAAELRLAVGRLSRQLRRLFAEARGSDEPTFLELAILQRLERVGASAVSELARGERVTTQAVSAVVAGLQRRGLVDTSTDPGDRRRTVVTVNARARSLLTQREQRITERLEAVLATTCSPAERRLLAQAAAVLDRVADAL